MITAHQAAELVRISQANLDTQLDRIGSLIEDAAKTGKREIYLCPEWISTGIESFSHPWWGPVMLALKAPPNSYRLQQDRIECGGGLGDLDYDPNNPQTTPVLYIRW